MKIGDIINIRAIALYAEEEPKTRSCDDSGVSGISLNDSTEEEEEEEEEAATVIKQVRNLPSKITKYI